MKKLISFVILTFSIALASPMNGPQLGAVVSTFKSLEITETKCSDEKLKLEYTAVVCGKFSTLAQSRFQNFWDTYFPVAMFENGIVKTVGTDWTYNELLGISTKLFAAGKPYFYVTYNVLKGDVTVEYVIDSEKSLKEIKDRLTLPNLVTLTTLISPVSFLASNGDQIRFAHLEQPKTKLEALQARSFVYSLTERQNLILELDGTPSEDFKPARVFVAKPNSTKGVYLNLEIVRAGWATITQDAPDDLKAAQQEAKNAKLGVWAI
jgi:endonuclease YncB( thermonuclease family)